MSLSAIQSSTDLAAQVRDAISTANVLDIHTHLYDPAFGRQLLWGIDELLVYHYLVAEAFRSFSIPYEKFWKLNRSEQAERIWTELFLEQSPISESCRGVLTTLQALGLDTGKRELALIRKWYAEQDVQEHVGRCLELAGVERVCMTNSPFDPEETAVWQAGFTRDPRFLAGLRIDPLLLDWPAAGRELSAQGYQVSEDLAGGTLSEARRFLEDWAVRISAKYLMVSLPPEFAFPSADACTVLLEKVVLPFCADRGLPLALMVGVRRGVNPQLQLAGDGVGRSDLRSLANLCSAYPATRFMATVLARENQHELCVLARKFRNLHVFGCWWFMNVPSLVEELTQMRLELLGFSFTAQHSDARVLDQLIYKWRHSRQAIGRALESHYRALAEAGWTISPEEIRRDVGRLLGGEFERFCRG